MVQSIQTMELKLTKAEEQVMLVLWELGKGFIKDVLEQFDDPKPAYTTIATILKILENKGFVSHKSYGKAYQYFPLVSKEGYYGKNMKALFSKYFKGSLEEVVSFFADNNKMNITDIDNAIRHLDELKKKKS